MARKWYVVDVQTIAIDSEWDDVAGANDRAVCLKEENGGTPVKVMTKPAVGSQQLDPNDDASWSPRRRSNPELDFPTYQKVIKRALKILPELDGSEAERGYVEEAIRHTVAAAKLARTFANEPGATTESAARKLISAISRRPNPRSARSLKKNPGELLIVNGAEPDSAKAEKVFEMWHKKNPSRVSVMRPGVDANDGMVCVGNACDIVYRSGKWEKGRKTNDYVHTFDSKPKVWMLADVVGVDAGSKTVESLLAKSRNKDGQFAVADLAAPISLSVDGGDGPEEIAIHSGARVYGGVDQRTVIIADPKWKLIVIRGGQMTFDERGIVK